MIDGLTGKEREQKHGEEKNREHASSYGKDPHNEKRKYTGWSTENVPKGKSNGSQTHSRIPSNPRMTINAEKLGRK